MLAVGCISVTPPPLLSLLIRLLYSEKTVDLAELITDRQGANAERILHASVLETLGRGWKEV